jgi:hypothetical protein
LPKNTVNISQNLGQNQTGQSGSQRSVSAYLTAVAVLPFIISAIIAAGESNGNAAKYGTYALFGSFCILFVIVTIVAFALTSRI